MQLHSLPRCLLLNVSDFSSSVDVGIVYQKAILIINIQSEPFGICGEDILRARYNTCEFNFHDFKLLFILGLAV